MDCPGFVFVAGQWCSENFDVLWPLSNRTVSRTKKPRPEGTGAKLAMVHPLRQTAQLDQLPGRERGSGGEVSELI
jgi:hypothetical protein